MKALLCIPCLMTGGTEIQTLNLVHAPWWKAGMRCGLCAILSELR